MKNSVICIQSKGVSETGAAWLAWEAPWAGATVESPGSSGCRRMFQRDCWFSVMLRGVAAGSASWKSRSSTAKLPGSAPTNLGIHLSCRSWWRPIWKTLGAEVTVAPDAMLPVAPPEGTAVPKPAGGVADWDQSTTPPLGPSPKTGSQKVTSYQLVGLSPARGPVVSSSITRPPISITGSRRPPRWIPRPWLGPGTDYPAEAGFGCWVWNSRKRLP